MKELLIEVLATVGIFLGATGLFIGSIQIASHMVGRDYFVRIDCSNCKSPVARSRIPQGEPVPPEPLKCDDCGNISGTMRY